MTRATLFATAALGLLTACSGQLGGPAPGPVAGTPYSQSVGFTGIGTGVATLARASVAPTPGQAAAHPVTRVKARSRTLASKARTAIGSVSARASVGTPVNVAGQPLLMHVVDVGDTRFAVLKKPRNVFSQSLQQGTNSAFKAQVPGLTGCAALSSGYGYGSSRARPIAIAIPLDCS